MAQSEHAPAPRGRHAPPLEVRQDRQRRRLFRAAAQVFARCGYVDATAEGIAREAGMSKATFYEHFDNKEDCIIALADAASELIMGTFAQGREGFSAELSGRERVKTMLAAFTTVLEHFPAESQTLLVEMVGAGPRAQERRDRMLESIAAYLDEINAESHAAGRVKRLATPHDAFAMVGAIVELASRQMRTGLPDDLRELEPVMERVAFGIIEQGTDTPRQ